MALDVVFGVQWSWSEPEEKPEQLRALSDCVGRRLDQGNRLWPCFLALSTDCLLSSQPV